jgi:hypothetical protein
MIISGRRAITQAAVSLPNPVNDGKAVADALEVAEATYRAAVARWPAARITLRQGARIVHESG